MSFRSLIKARFQGHISYQKIEEKAVKLFEFIYVQHDNLLRFCQSFRLSLSMLHYPWTLVKHE